MPLCWIVKRPDRRQEGLTWSIILLGVTPGQQAESVTAEEAGQEQTEHAHRHDLTGSAGGSGISSTSSTSAGLLIFSRPAW